MSCHLYNKLDQNLMKDFGVLFFLFHKFKVNVLERYMYIYICDRFTNVITLRCKNWLQIITLGFLFFLNKCLLCVKPTLNSRFFLSKTTVWCSCHLIFWHTYNNLISTVTKFHCSNNIWFQTLVIKPRLNMYFL